MNYRALTGLSAIFSLKPGIMHAQALFSVWLCAGIFSGFLLILACFAVRTRLQGQEQFERVARQGDSFLLGAFIMNAIYWWGRPFSRLLIRLGATPNGITWFGLLSGIMAGVSVAEGRFDFGIVFAILAGMCDMLDGVVAKETGRTSAKGELLDSVMDRYVDFAVLAGFAMYYMDRPFMLLMALLAIHGSFMISYSSSMARERKLEPPRGAMKRTDRYTWLLYGIVLSPLSIAWIESRLWPDAVPPLALPGAFVVCLIAILGNYSACQRLMFIANAVEEKGN